MQPPPSRGAGKWGQGLGKQQQCGAGAADKRAERGPGSPGPPHPPFQSSCHPQQGRALKKQASRNALVGKPAGALPEAWSPPKGQLPEATPEPRAQEQKSKDEALDTGAHRPRGSREKELGGSPAEEPLFLPWQPHPGLASSP